MKNIIRYELFEAADPQINPAGEKPHLKIVPKGLITGATLLRKLAMKSRLGFGKWNNQMIETLIKLGEAQYLRWVYFNSSNIDFMDDILHAIGIPDNVRIKKPGKDPELGDKLDKEIYKAFGFQKKELYNFDKEVDNYKSKQIAAAMGKEEKLDADKDSARTEFKFGRLEGGRSKQERPRRD